MRAKPIDITGGVPSEVYVQRLRGECPEDEWQRPADASPNDGQDVLVWLQCYDADMRQDTHHMMIARFIAAQNHYRHGQHGQVLFWRPLPEPPTDSPRQA